MKELLQKLTKNYVVIGFKSGNTMEGAVIEAVKGNVVIVTYNGSITIIGISQIAYVTPQAGIVEVVKSIFSSEEDEREEIKPELATQEEAKLEVVAQEEVEPEVVTEEEAKPEAVTQEEVKPEVVTEEEAKPETVTQEEVKPEENSDSKKDSGQGKKGSKHHHHHHHHHH